MLRALSALLLFFYFGGAQPDRALGLVQRGPSVKRGRYLGGGLALAFGGIFGDDDKSHVGSVNGG